MRLPDHPEPVTGAAVYWADHNDVLMRDNEGHTSVIDCKRSGLSAAKAAKAWQIKENKIVTKNRSKG